MDGTLDFNAIFGSEPHVAYSQKTIKTLENHRLQLDHQLFFDRLLGITGLSTSTADFPPRSNKELRAFFQKIASGSLQDHQKHSLIRYIRKDLNLTKNGPPALDRTGHLPQKYQLFIDGIWCLDRLQVEEALLYLTDPCLTPTFSDDILYVACRNAQGSPAIALTYFQAVSPPLETRKTLEAYFETLCRLSITEAYYFYRSRDDSTRRHLLEQLISFAHETARGKERAIRATELMGLPFSSDERSHMERFIRERCGKHLTGAKESLLMRGLATDWS